MAEYTLPVLGSYPHQPLALAVLFGADGRLAVEITDVGEQLAPLTSEQD